ncbi:dual specificity protein phosphatase 12 isoform X2 [Cuculus canorus]|uniref:dual specificity protein phosphatase 12 isoform X2 n=1 Tax=Cuculus canorus TaxID=55661 RepID=UPI0023AB4116|nr:dual specificity protein phosphatase 12 isoform X2 [Cuculus canorus]
MSVPGGGSAPVSVWPGLLVGGAESCQSAEALRAVGVSAVLTVGAEAEAAAAVPGLRCLHVQARDEPRADLLSRLDECAAFISAARGVGGAVLVRWVNPGFQAQLKLYEAMGCTVDMSSPLYKRYRLELLTEHYSELQDLPREVFAADPTSTCQTPDTEVLYRCRKCRRALFRSSSILSHMEGSGPAAFAHKRITGSAQLRGGGREMCTSYFTEPVQWMEPALLGVLEGQLLCPKCTSKLGSFSWRGEQCSCGRWVTPAFQIHKSRVDEVRTLPVGNIQAAKT